MTTTTKIEATLPGSHCHICHGSTWQISKQVFEKSFSIHTDVEVTCTRCNYTELRHFEFHQFKMLETTSKHLHLLSTKLATITRTCFSAILRQYAASFPPESVPIQYIRPT